MLITDRPPRKNYLSIKEREKWCNFLLMFLCGFWRHHFPFRWNFISIYIIILFDLFFLPLLPLIKTHYLLTSIYYEVRMNDIWFFSCYVWVFLVIYSFFELLDVYRSNCCHSHLEIYNLESSMFVESFSLAQKQLQLIREEGGGGLTWAVRKSSMQFFTKIGNFDFFSIKSEIFNYFVKK